MAEIDAVRGSIEAALAAKTGSGDGAGNDAAASDGKADRAKLAELSTRLRSLQGEQPLIFPVVDGQAIAEIVEGWTGIPARRMQSDEIRTVLNLRESMERRVIGQSHALEAVAQAIRTSRAGLTDPRRPIGVFLFVGTSGVGKTETALSLAQLLYGGEQNVTTINMSEFKEEHKVSLLMGSPPGYVGYGEGGVLTEAVRRRPYSVVLLDEMEKAHPGVQDVFYLGVRQGQHEGRRRPRHRFQEHRHHHDEQRRHGPDHQAVCRSRDRAGCRGSCGGTAARTGEVFQAGLSRARDAGAIFPAFRLQ